ncbi:MAG: hypothetical protein EA383_05305 [Spirochaetaceae bacterium]|nr:MAG: hypothetical protein EA383_05305 [Spirochaetaceae bacterium]
MAGILKGSRGREMKDFREVRTRASVFPIIILCLILVSTSAAADPPSEQTGRIGVSFWPGANLALGAGAEAIGIGQTGFLGAEYRLSSLPLFIGADAYYGQAAIVNTGAISSFSGFGVVGARIPIAPRARLLANAFIGAGFNTLSFDSEDRDDVSQLSIGYGTTVGLEVPLTEIFAVGLRAGYLAHANTYNGLLVSAGTVISLPRIERSPRPPREPDTPLAPEPIVATDVPSGASLRVGDVRFDSIFPVFYGYYDQNPIGTATVQNRGTTAVRDISIRLHVPRFMDMPRTQNVPRSLDPGEQVEIELYALMNEEILRVTEGTRVSVQLEVAYTTGDEADRYSLDGSLEVLNRNAMTWDDDRKAASFVTARDPVVLSLARNVASVVRASGFDAINLNVRTAIALTEAITLHGVNYVIDPTSPYAELSGQPHAVDFLQFPRETLEYRAGDCDDLSILYAALLEAVGIPAAFITVPGHIYVAFSTGLSQAQAQRIFSRADEIIIQDDIAWIPVEATILNEGFLQAWQMGARQWREHSVRGQAEIYPIAEAWDVYPAVGLPDSPPSIAAVSPQALEANYYRQLTRFVDREIFPQVSRLRTLITQSDNDPRHINRLGVLYARHGLDDRARQEFSRIADRTPPYPSALINLGNLEFLARDIHQALDYYERAQRLAPDNPVVLLAIARCHHEMENYGFVAHSYNRLKEINPDLAEEFSYLDFRGEEARRAAQVAEMVSRVVWDEE